VTVLLSVLLLLAVMLLISIAPSKVFILLSNVDDGIMCTESIVMGIAPSKVPVLLINDNQECYGYRRLKRVRTF
jgi:hypothetical protein